MYVSWREGEREVGQNKSYEHLKFKHSQVLSKTNSWTNSVVNWLQIGFAGNLKSRHDLRHRGTILLAGSKDP